MNVVKASSGTGVYEIILETDKHRIISDEPVSSGGNDRGLSPQQLLASALASCTIITMKMYAKRKDWNPEGMKAVVHYQRDDKHRILDMRIEIELGDNFSAEQKERLLQIAEHCPVHKALTESVPISVLLK